MRIGLFTMVFLLCFIFSFSQTKPVSKIKTGSPVFGDYKDAIKLPLTKSGSYGPTLPPKGFGKIKEIKACDKQDVSCFEKEHNSAWYYFIAPEDGEIILDIIPANPKDDYDFMLFKYTDTSFCNEIKRENLSPIRMNMARAGSDSSGITGLSNTGEEEIVVAGQDKPFCKPLKVKKDEKYYLVLDNVYPKGNGHTINIFYQKEIWLSGTVENDLEKPVVASVSINNKEGKELAKTFTDVRGKYTLDAKIHEAEYYTVVFYNDSSFISCMEVSASSLAKSNYELINNHTLLPKLKNGKKYVLDVINFSGTTCRMLPTSIPSVNALAALMKKNNKMVIKIEGHINNPLNASNTGVDHTLGEARAKTIYENLLKQGIEKERLDYTSYGSLFMIYPKPTTEAEREANNRVEIFVLTLK